MRRPPGLRALNAFLGLTFLGLTIAGVAIIVYGFPALGPTAGGIVVAAVGTAAAIELLSETGP